MRLLSAGIISILLVALTISVCFAQTGSTERYKLGVEYAILGKFEKAKEEFQNALRIDPFFVPPRQSLLVAEDVIAQRIGSETAIHIFRATAYANKKQWDNAIDECSKVIETNPKYAEIYILRGGINSEKNNNDQSIKDYTKALEISPKNAMAYFNRGNVYSSEGQYDQAITDYTKALAINPKDFSSYGNRGAAYRHKDNFNQAVIDYNKALEINPNLVTVHYNLGFIYMVKLGDKQKGCYHWKRACELGECRNYERAKSAGYCK